MRALERFDETIGLEKRGQESDDSTTERSSDTDASRSSLFLPGRSNSEVTTKNHQRQFSYWESVANIGVPVGSAIQYAHDQGIQHRDIKAQEMSVARISKGSHPARSLPSTGPRPMSSPDSKSKQRRPHL